jgi:predicted amidohydrolase
MKKGTLRAALCQMNIVWENKEASQALCLKFVKQAVRARAEIIIFPEMTLTGFSMNTRKNSEEMSSSASTRFFSELAKTYSIYIVFGLAAKKMKSVNNAAIVIDPRGKMIAQYSKIHPFSYGKENRYFDGGTEVSIFKVKDFICSLVICYDLRFPGLFEGISQKNPDIIIVIANWPAKRIKHWNLLLPARALDMQSYVLGINRTGEGEGVVYCGNSAAYDPSGKKLLIGRAKPGNIYVDLDRAVVHKTRKEFPSLKDKKYSLYKKL